MKGSQRALSLAMAALFAAGLAACNFPVDTPTPTAAPLNSEQIEVAVGQTLIAEGALTEAASDAGIREQPAQNETAEPAASDTPDLTSTSSATPTPSATATPLPTETPQPSNTPQPSSTPRPSDTPRPTNSPPPTDTEQPRPTECAKFTNGSLRASGPGVEARVTLTWSSSGGCAPISGTITATYEGQRDPYAKHEVSGNSGKIEDQIAQLEPCKGGIYDIVYQLVLLDASGASITTSAKVQIQWDC